MLNIQSIACQRYLNEENIYLSNNSYHSMTETILGISIDPHIKRIEL